MMPGTRLTSRRQGQSARPDRWSWRWQNQRRCDDQSTHRNQSDGRGPVGEPRWAVASGAHPAGFATGASARCEKETSCRSHLHCTRSATAAGPRPFRKYLAVLLSEKPAASRPSRHPVLVPRGDSFARLGVRPLFPVVLAEMGISSPFPIQVATLGDSALPAARRNDSCFHPKGRYE